MGNGTTRGMRLHIGLFGQRNVGKSCLMNALTHQQVSIVSPEAGTTTDPVQKTMELLPLGPVVFIDTAGIDDAGRLGDLRLERTRRVMDRVDLCLVIAAGDRWGPFEDQLVREFRRRDTPVIAVFNKIDLSHPSRALAARLAADQIPVVLTAALTGFGVPELRQVLLDTVPNDLVNSHGILDGVTAAGDLVVLVTPIDRAAPKERMILPQNQTIRAVLDHDAQCVVTRETRLGNCLESLARPPDLVITDSQVFALVGRLTPDTVELTSFSVLFARWKGNLTEFVRGTLAIDRLRPGDRVLVAEACTHHPVEDDIGRVKIPRWLDRKAGGDLEWVHVRGHEFPRDLRSFQLVVHCGACMFNRREMLTRMLRCREADVPITNYGLTIAHVHGILTRAVAPFPAAAAVLKEVGSCASA